MDLIELIDTYRNKLDEDPYSCLLFALQLPSICSRIECERHPELYEGCWNNKKKHRLNDGAAYERWLVRHIFYLKHLFTPFMNSQTFVEKVYKLRCLLTHEGVLLERSTDDNDFCFVEGDVTFALPNMLFLSPSSFCNAMFDSACSFLLMDGVSPNVSSYFDLLLPLKDYINIMNDVRVCCDKWAKCEFECTNDRDDSLLYILYDWLNVYYSAPKKMNGDSEEIDDESKKKTSELKKMEEFFKENPDEEYVMFDFSRRCAVIPDVNRLYIKEEQSRHGSPNYKTFNLHLTKNDYDRMMYLHSSFTKFYEYKLKEKIDSYFKSRDIEKHLTDNFDCDTL